MKTIWTESASLKKFDIPKDNIICDVLVIGGGLCGILTAFRIAKSGKKTVLCEADRLMSGQSAGTTAKITAQHGYLYSELEEKNGQKFTCRYAKANLDAINEYKRLIADEKIDCDFEECSAYIYSLKNLDKLKKEATAQKNAGLDVSLTNDTELPFKVSGAIRVKGQAKFNPMKFVAGLLNKIPDNLTIYEKTMATKVEKNIVYMDCMDEQGKKLERVAASGNIVFCCHFPFINFPGLYFARMHCERVYALALECNRTMKNEYIGIPDEKDLSFGDLSFRGYSDGNKQYILLLGSAHRTGDNNTGGKYSALRKKASLLFPGSKVVYKWSIQDCMTPDKIAYIGEYSPGAPDGWYVATGFNKWGMTTSMIASILLCAYVNKRKLPDYAKLYDPSRFDMTHIPQMANDGIYAVKGFLKENLEIPTEKIDDIPLGGAGTIEIDGEILGVYRESETMYHLVNTRCPHLGCRLEWNPDEKSWDCPCHGSRFDYLGNLINNPALTNIN